MYRAHVAVGRGLAGQLGDGVRFMTEDASGAVWRCYNNGAVVRLQERSTPNS